MSQTSIGLSRKWPQRMRRKMASEYLLDEHGVSLSPATLAKLASIGARRRSTRTALSRSTTVTVWMRSQPRDSADFAPARATFPERRNPGAVFRTATGAEISSNPSHKVKLHG